ncbi:hypothetical protein SRHO_G00152980 [Serrasalmus rhombeus]
MNVNGGLFLTACPAIAALSGSGAPVVWSAQNASAAAVQTVMTHSVICSVQQDVFTKGIILVSRQTEPHQMHC